MITVRALLAVLLSTCTCTAYITIEQDIENLTREECPTWFVKNEASRECTCGPSLSGAVRCTESTQKVWLDLFFCMTYESTTGATLVGECPFSTLQRSDYSSDSYYVLVPKELTLVNETFCGKANREGLLCSKCKAGYGPPMFLYGVKCTECSASQYSWLFFLLLSCVPMTIFFLVLILCQIRTTSAPLNGFITLSQLLAISLKMYPQVVSDYSGPDGMLGIIALSFLSLWNLDFFPFLIPTFCVSEYLSNLQVLCMEYVAAFAPLFLIVIMYICIQQHARDCKLLIWLWKPFGYCLAPVIRRFEWNPAKYTVQIFASFLHLSCAKILFTSFSLLKTTRLYSNDDSIKSYEHSPLLFYDPSIIFFSNEHLPYAFLAITVSVTFVVLPCLVLILYPTRLFHKCLNRCRIRWHAIHVFADAFNGCYKDGTDSTRDCRCFAGFYLLVRLTFLLLQLTPYSMYSVVRSASAIATLLVFALASPYKTKFFNVVDSVWITLAALISIAPSGSRIYQTVTGSTTTIALLVYFTVFLAYKIIRRLNFLCCRKLQSLTQRMTVNSNRVSSPRVTCDRVIEEQLPDRLENPGRYQILSEDDDEGFEMSSYDINSNISSITAPTYGIIEN